MKKIFSTFIIIFLFGFFVLPRLSLADVSLTAPDILPDGVTLKATGLDANKSVTFTVRNNINSPATPTYFQTKDEVSDSSGETTTGFLSLFPTGKYTVAINYTGEIPTLKIITFDTPTLPVTIDYDFLKSTSVTLNAGELTSGKQVIFTLESLEPAHPYNKTSTSAVNLGIASSQEDFSGLTPSCHYKGSVAYSDDSTNTLNIVMVNTPASDGDGNPPPDITPPPSTTDTKTPTDLSTKGGGLVPPCPKNGCGFIELFILIKKVTDFILFDLALPVAAIMFAYAGFMLVASAGASEKRTKAKGVFINVAIGLVVVAAAWLIVHTVLGIAGYDQNLNWFGL